MATEQNVFYPYFCHFFFTHEIFLNQFVIPFNYYFSFDRFHFKPRLNKFIEKDTRINLRQIYSSSISLKSEGVQVEDMSSWRLVFSLFFLFLKVKDKDLNPMYNAGHFIFCFKRMQCCSIFMLYYHRTFT